MQHGAIAALGFIIARQLHERSLVTNDSDQMEVEDLEDESRDRDVRQTGLSPIVQNMGKHVHGTFWRYFRCSVAIAVQRPGQMQATCCMMLHQHVASVWPELHSIKSDVRIYPSRQALLILRHKINRNSIRGKDHRTNLSASIQIEYRALSPSPFTPTSDQFQISSAASPEILHHTVWRTWAFIV